MLLTNPILFRVLSTVRMLNGVTYGLSQCHAGRCSDRSMCAEGDSSTEPYICTHSLLAAHAAAVPAMRAAAPHAKISINWSVTWALPSNASDTVSSTGLSCEHYHQMLPHCNFKGSGTWALPSHAFCKINWPVIWALSPIASGTTNQPGLSHEQYPHLLVTLSVQLVCHMSTAIKCSRCCKLN